MINPVDGLRSAVINSTDLGAITLVTRAWALVWPHVIFFAMAESENRTLSSFIPQSVEL